MQDQLSEWITMSNLVSTMDALDTVGIATNAITEREFLFTLGGNTFRVAMNDGNVYMSLNDADEPIGHFVCSSWQEPDNMAVSILGSMFTVLSDPSF